MRVFRGDDASRGSTDSGSGFPAIVLLWENRGKIESSRRGIVAESRREWARFVLIGEARVEHLRWVDGSPVWKKIFRGGGIIDAI